jgi:hypothetical protein
MLGAGCSRLSPEAQARRHFLAAAAHEQHYPWQSTESVNAYRARQLRKAIRLDPENAHYRYALAEHLDDGDPERERCYQRAASLSSLVAAQYCTEAALDDVWEDAFGRALWRLSMARKADPGNALVDYLIAYCHAQLGDLGNARESIREGNAKGRALRYVSEFDRAYDSIHGPGMSFGLDSVSFRSHSRIRELARQMVNLRRAHVRLCPAPTVRPDPTEDTTYTTPRLAERLFEAGRYADAESVCRQTSAMASIYAQSRPENLMPMLVGSAVDSMAVRTLAELRWRRDHDASFPDLEERVQEWEKLRVSAQPHTEKSSQLTARWTWQAFMVLTGGQAVKGGSRVTEATNRAVRAVVPLVRCAAALLPPILLCLVFTLVVHRVWSGSASRRGRAAAVALLCASVVTAVGVAWQVYYAGYDPVTRAFELWYIREERNIDGGDAAFAKGLVKMVPDPMTE